MILSLIKDNYFSVNENGIFDWVIGSTANDNTDRYALWADIDSYDQKRLEAYALYKNDNNAWMKKAVINTASSVYFSSDRTINEYAHKIWNMKSVQ